MSAKDFNAFNAFAQKAYKAFEAQPSTSAADIGALRAARAGYREYLDCLRELDGIIDRAIILVKQINSGELPVNTATHHGRNNSHLKAVVTALVNIRQRLTDGGAVVPGEPPKES